MPNTPVLGLPYPESTDTADVPRDIKALAEAIEAQSVLPPGAMLFWPGDAAPAGWAVCDGQTVDAALNPKLAAIFGSAGGLVTLPDMRDRVPIGASATKAARSTGGANQRTLQIQHLPQHAHQHAPGMATAWQGAGTGFAKTHVTGDSGGPVTVITPTQSSNRVGSMTDHNGNVSSFGQAFDTTPAHVAVHVIVKLG